MFIQPSKVTNMYKENKQSNNSKTKLDRRRGSHSWFNKDCELLLKIHCLLKTVLIKKHQYTEHTWKYNLYQKLRRSTQRNSNIK